MCSSSTIVFGEDDVIAPVEEEDEVWSGTDMVIVS